MDNNFFLFLHFLQKMSQQPASQDKKSSNVHRSKKDKNKHKKNKPSKHFVGTGQLAGKGSGSGKKRFVQQSEEDRALFGPREITSNASKYEQEEQQQQQQDDDDLQAVKRRTVQTLLYDKSVSVGVSFYRKAWEQEWDQQEIENANVSHVIHIFYNLLA